MASPVIATHTPAAAATIALVGGGPAALVAAIALARRGISTSVFERDAHPDVRHDSMPIARTPFERRCDR